MMALISACSASGTADLSKRLLHDPIDEIIDHSGDAVDTSESWLGKLCVGLVPPQFASRTGIMAFSKTCWVAPPNIICLSRLWV
jgi:hypothetical protein